MMAKTRKTVELLNALYAYSGYIIMGQASKYWTILLLDGTGKTRSRELSSIKIFLESQFPTALEEDSSLTEDQLIRSLIPLAPTQPEVQLLLRCLISHQVLVACQSLANQFGQFYGFTTSDLIPLVLDDDGKPWNHSSKAEYKILAQQILDRFDPAAGKLSTWVTRLVRQHPAISAFLLDHGLYLVSDWAILNDTKPDQLYRIWTQHYNLSPEEAEQACCLLESFRLVYTPERRPGSRCKDPTTDQQDRIAQTFSAALERTISTAEMQKQLTQLCKRLRAYRILARGGQVRGLSVDDAQTLERIQDKIGTADRLLDDSEDNRSRDRMLSACRDIFDSALPRALHTAITQAHNQFLNSNRQDTRKKAKLYFPALRLFHGDRISMGEIAPRVGINGQDGISRLLNLSELRAQVRDLVLTQCFSQIKPILQTQGGLTCDQIDRAIAAIEALFAEQIDPILDEEEKRTRTPKPFDRPTRFAQAVCDQLDALGA
jgi:hypothetical protein